MALKGEARMPRHSHDARIESQVAADVVHDTAFSVPFVHRLRFTRNVFDAANHVLADVLGEPANGPHRLLVCLDEGVASSPADIDLAMITGIGFPPFRGGLCRWADAQGLTRLVEEMERLSSEVGARHEPSGAVQNFAAAGGFYAA